MVQSSARDRYWIQPVGQVNSPIDQANFDPRGDTDPELRKEEVRRHHERVRDSRNTLVIFPEYEDLLDGIEAFSHILVLFWPHQLPEGHRTLKKVHPMGRRDIPLQGIFATRSPARPNPILISQVRLIERQGLLLHVQGLDALDLSPILDIKPVIRQDDNVAELMVPDWIRQIHEDLGR